MEQRDSGKDGKMIKKCPNCNSRPKGIDYHGLCFWVECPRCGVRTSYSFKTPEEATKAWNKGETTKKGRLR